MLAAIALRELIRVFSALLLYAADNDMLVRELLKLSVEGASAYAHTARFANSSAAVTGRKQFFFK